MLSIDDIVDAVAFPFSVWRTLGGLVPEMRDGRPVYVAGNAAVSFRVAYRGERKMLKCYTRTNENLKAIYGAAYRAKELCVIDMVGRHHWVDCLLMDYVEGRTLDEAICAAATEEEFVALAAGFDRMASELLSSERAHGDLKPENIIVRDDGAMVAIDWDNAFVPSFAGRRSPEIGTAAYQHPARTAEMFDKHVDDYSIAFISTLLHLMTVDESAAEHYRQLHEPKFLPSELINSNGWLPTSALAEVLETFARRGMAREYRVAQMLSSATPYLSDLKRVMEFSQLPFRCDAEAVSLEYGPHGWWGCKSGEEWIIPPLYSGGFEPSEGMVLLELGAYRHFISLESGRVVASFDRATNVGPLRNGSTKIRRADGEELVITREELINSPKKSIFVR